MIRSMILVAACCAALVALSACGGAQTSDQVQTAQQETILAEGTAQVGMPAIKNFRERKLLKDIIEMRDQDGILTYTYIVAENTGKLAFICNSIGYGLPAATQFTSPEKVYQAYSGHDGIAIPQADPNGLFSPSSAEGTWVMCADPNGGKKALPLYIEPRVIVSPFKLSTQ